MNETKQNIVIVGIGNEIRCDDAIGIVVGKRLADSLACDFIEETSVDLSLIDLFEKYEKVILIDSVKTGGKVGTLYEIPIADLPGKKAISAHSRDFHSLIYIAKNNGVAVESRVLFFAIEIFKNNEFGENLSPDLASQIPVIEEEIRKIIIS